MPRVSFTRNLQRHVSCPPEAAAGDTVAEALADVFSRHERLREYIVDEQGALRKHILVFLDGELIRDRVHQSDAASPNAEIHVMQALSGG